MLITQTVRFIPLSTLRLPDELIEVLADCSRFTFGNNDHSLVDPNRIAAYLDVQGWDLTADKFKLLAAEYPGIFIDLEN